MAMMKRPDATIARKSARSTHQQNTLVDETITVVLIGETGAGKSSLINLFHFWARESCGEQPKFENVKRHSIISSENEAGGSRSGSQTLKPHPYKFVLNFENRVFNFLLLDTPGMGDVKGLKQDDEHIMAILKFVENTPMVNGIMLMLNGSNCIVTSRTLYILQRLYGMCPQTFQNHLYLIFSNTQLEPNFDWQNEIKVPIHRENVIPIDNLLFSPGGLNYATCNNIQQKRIEKNYQENKEILSIIFQRLIAGGSLRPDAYKQLRENRDELRLKVSGILAAIKQLNLIKDEINKEKSELINNVAPTLTQLRKKADMTTETVQVEKRYTPYHNTQCLDCAAICHENCQLTYTATAGDNIFQGCACMRNNICKDCKHDYTTHVHVKFMYIHKIIKVPLLSDAERDKLNSVNDMQEKKKILLQKLENRLAEIENQIQTLKNELKDTLKKLKILCPYYDYQMELQCAIRLLEDEELAGAKKHDPEYLRELKYYFVKLINEFDEAQAP